MSYCFEASHVFVQEDEYMVMFGFADDEYEPSQFIVLQKTKNYDEQDKRMGMDKIHIQVEDQSRAMYGGIKSILKSGEKLIIYLEDEAKPVLQVDGEIEINLKVSYSKLEDVLDQLGKFLRDEGIKFELNG